MDVPSVGTRGAFLRPLCSRVQTTIGELINTRPDPTSRHDCPQAIYIIRDGDVDLYVGQTIQGVRARLKAHIRVNQWENDRFGAAYRAHRPASDRWTVQVIYIKTSLGDAERFYINHLTPKYNKQRPVRLNEPTFEVA